MAAKAMDQAPALADLERRLTAIVPAWSAPGFPSKGQISLQTLNSGDPGYGRLDGLMYRNADAEVVVTTRSLLKRWVAEHKNRWGIPELTDAAIRSEPFWTAAMSSDASAWAYGEISLVLPRQDATLAVLLVRYAKDNPFDAGPGDIVAAMISSDRVLIARQKLSVKTEGPAVCRGKLQSAQALPVPAGSHIASDSSDRKNPSLSNQMIAADRDYRRCFAAHLREQPQWKAIDRQALALVELLH